MRLKELILDKNHLEGKKLRVMRESMMHNTALSLLSMNNCGLEEEGTYFISQGLLKNKTLKTLLVSNNNLKDQGLINFADVINFYTFALENLDVS